MKEKYFSIEPQYARQLLDKIKYMESQKHGIDRHAFLLDDYAVLSTSRIKLRNVVTRDDDLTYFDEIIEALFDLRDHGVGVVPILGYCYDPSSQDGTGYIIQRRAKGEELFDDAVISGFQVWAQGKSGNTYLTGSLNDEEAVEYLLSRTFTISQIPQAHFDKFIADMIHILKKDILIDFNGSSNFFYDADVGFQFIDLDSHNDYKYGLSTQKPDIEEILSVCGYVPCHYAVGTEYFASSALDEQALLMLTYDQHCKLAEDNHKVFEKCKVALANNGVSEASINKSLGQLRIYGQ